MTRWQLPAHSPLTLRGIAGAALDVAGGREAALRALRDRLRDRFAADVVTLTDSGTHALQLALAAVASSRPDRPVALPAYTCYDVATAALGADVTVMFYDVDPEALTPDLDGVRACLRAGCGTVMVNVLHGFPVDWHALRDVCAAHGAVLIEDAAQAGGSGWAGRPAGTFGDLTVLSFGRGKGWTGGAGGGLLARGDLGRAVRAAGPEPSGRGGGARALVASGVQWFLGRPRLFGVPRSIPALRLGETRFHPPTPPGGMPPYVAASVVRHEAAAVAEVDVRRRHAARWRRLLDDVEATGLGLSLCTPLDASECGYLRLPARASGHAAEVLSQATVVRAGVARGYPKALPDLPALASVIRGGSANVPGARELARNLHTFPAHSLVDNEDFTTVGSAFGPSR